MQTKPLVVINIALIILISSCSKKHVPQQTTATVSTSTAPVVKKMVVKKTPLVSVAKVIIVNDSVAKKNIDGRLYYDVGGHRYWRNYNDGKYYLFNKSMYTDSAFIPH
ncbi:hypothetical protein [Ferruginibacter sp.]|nr:hypothetical protein [Ferruginibacter sp.]